MMRLSVSSGAQRGQEFPVDRPVIRLGRSSTNDIILQESQASRQHAEISQQGDQYVIRDLGSMNGTLVNGRRITSPQVLRPGDEIRIGDTVLTFTPGAAAPVGAATDWEARLMTGEEAAQGGGRRGLLYALAGVVALLLVAVAVAAFLLFGRGKPTPTPVVAVTTEAATPAIVVADTATPPPAAVATDTPLVNVPTVSLQPTPLPVKPPVVKPPSVPTGLPLKASDLEGLPAAVTQLFPGVSAEQLPGVLAQKLATLPPQQMQSVIFSLFPGVALANLPGVIAASLPGVPPAAISAVLAQVFPGQKFPAPSVGQIGGRLALAIWPPGEANWGLYLAPTLGGQPTKLVDLGSHPGFSPDGKWLVYHSCDPAHHELRLIQVDGKNDRSLTKSSKDFYPSFSPDGERIVFFDADTHNIEVINRDGSGRRGLTEGEYPAWSPAGDQIVYRGCVGGGSCGLVVANSDGSNKRLITRHANDSAPRWSPSGGQVVFHSDRDGNWECYVINIDGSWLRRITFDAATDVMPVWSPDGLRVAFRSDRGGKWRVYTTTPVGGGATPLFDADLRSADWMFGRMDWSK